MFGADVTFSFRNSYLQPHFTNFAFLLQILLHNPLHISVLNIVQLF